MLKTANKNNFDEIYTIMEDSFPPDERRSYENQKALLEKESYCILTVNGEDGRVMAFAAVYDLGEILFLEHFAVGREHRNAGLGSKILGALSSQYGKRICLEVEPPTTDIAARRIGFYERNGFTLNRYDYTQPSLGEGKKPLPLMLMTTGGVIGEEEYPEIKTVIYREVYDI